MFRIHQDAGYITLPHTHPTDENITVVKGTWSLGTGRRFNRSALEHMETGTFGMVPKNMVRSVTATCTTRRRWCDDHQHEHQVIRSGRDHEEVGGHHLADVVREECSPRLRRWID